MTHVKYFSKSELRKANRRATKAGCRAIDPTYIEQLPEGLRYPVYFTLPWERHGWVRCQIGTATCIPPHDLTPVFIDIQQASYDKLPSIEVQEDEEVTQ